MQTDVFEWVVAEYTWVQTRADAGGGATREQWVLGEVCSGRPFPAARSYEPLAVGGLFLNLADTAPTRDAILRFAGRFGTLGRPALSGPATTMKDRQGRTVRLTGEPLEFWQLQISALAQASGLWHLLQVGDAAGLAAHVRWQKDAAERDEVYYVSHPGLEDGAVTPSGHVAAEELIAAPTFHPERLARFRPGDVALPALHYVQDKINARLAGPVSSQLVWDAERNRSTLRLVPDSLLGCLWVQFAQAVANDKGFRRCGQCGLWFELGPQAGRRSRLFCSGACRTRAHRARREKAWELHRQGKNPREIAAATATGLGTVRKWLKQAKD
jgi:hypothetical protein